MLSLTLSKDISVPSRFNKNYFHYKHKKMSSQMTKWMTVVAAVVVVVGLLLDYLTNLSLAEQMRDKMQQQQEAAYLLHNTVSFRLMDWLSDGRWRVTCPAPSTAWVFVPIVGRGMAARHYHAYMECMEGLHRQAEAAITTLLCGVACLVVVGCLFLTVWFQLRQRSSVDQEDEEDDGQLYTADPGDDVVLQVEKDEEDQYFTAEPGDDVSPDSQAKDCTQLETDEKFHLEGIPFLSGSDIEALTVSCELGRGAYGRVSLVNKDGEVYALKQLLRSRPSEVRDMLREAQLSVQLDGAGGVPRARGVCLDPPAVLLEFAGHTYDKFLEVCSTAGVIDSLANIAACLNELHRAGVVHNDLKVNNITFSGGVNEPIFHLIDLGLSTHPGEVVKVAVKEEERAKYWWYAPEMLEWRPVFSSADVYSFGALVHKVLKFKGADELRGDLQWLVDACMQQDPTLRPSLAKVRYTFRSVKASKPWLYGDH